jgi:hypothetical protein
VRYLADNDWLEIGELAAGRASSSVRELARFWRRRDPLRAADHGGTPIGRVNGRLDLRSHKDIPSVETVLTAGILLVSIIQLYRTW